ncbi:MAG: hypothetical protein M3P26_07375 [Gemmatimonadota bacterium]|nr:hypothetical protein [Gemmatimonadota bacterium]
MELRFAHLADYATAGERGKLTIVGIFEVVGASPQRPIPLPPFHLVGSFQAHLPEGSDHELEIRVVNADGGELARATIPMKFSPTLQKRLEAPFAIGMVGMNVPDVGDYAFHLFVDGQHRGAVPLQVVPAPPT